MDVGPNDIVWTTPISFVASANCARYCGAKIDFVDIDPSTRLMSVEKLKQKLEQAREKNILPKVVIPVHFAGQACDMAAIKALAEDYQFSIIEDAAHAIGSRYEDTKIGDCQYSDITIYSFHPVKTLTTAEGGAITTNSDELNQKVRQLLTHGITRDTSLLQNQDEGGWYYEQQALGFNYRLSDLHAALGESQLKRLDEFVAKRGILFSRYNQLLSSLPLKLPQENAKTLSAWHLYVIEIEDAQCTRREIFDFLRANNIGVNVHYIPIHMQPDFRAMGFKSGDFPAAEAYYKNAISLPLYPDLSVDEQDYIVAKLGAALKNKTAVNDLAAVNKGGQE